MRKLYLLRHAKSSWDDPSMDDFDRPLTNRGRKNARQMAKFLAATRVRPAMALVSPARRSRTTFDAIEAKIEGVPVAYEEGLYEAGRSQLLDRLHRLDDHLPSVMVVGHNPGLERLVHALCAGHGDAGALARLKEKFPTCTLAVLDFPKAHWAELAPGTCRLVEFIRPKDLGEAEE